MSLQVVKNHKLLCLGVAFAVFYWVAEALVHTTIFADEGPLANLIPHDAHELYMRTLVCLLLLVLGIYADRLLNRMRRLEKERLIEHEQLEEALTKVLGGFIVICARCKRVREGEEWQPVEAYVEHHSAAQFSHGVCPDCVKLLYPELVRAE